MSDKERVKDLKNLFITECKSGIWKQHYTVRFLNEYFSVEKETQTKEWIVVFEKEAIFLKELGVSKFRFWFLLRKIRSSSNNYAKLIREKKIAELTNSFFKKNVSLTRDKSIEEILESRY
jgi:hypothetical protein